MPPADAPGRTTHQRPKRSGNGIGVIARGVRQVNVRPSRAPAPRVAPARSPVFGPLPRQTHPLQRAVAQAQRKTAQTRRPVTRRTSVPYVPKLTNPTNAQRGAAAAIVSSGLQAQGVTSRELTGIRGGAAGRTQQVRLNRATGYARTLQARQPAAARGSFPARPGPTHQRVHLLPGATIDLTGLTRSLDATVGQRLAGNPISATTRGLSELASVRPLSDKGVLGRSANDLLTYPAAAIPTAYAAVTHPRKFAGDALSQVTHPGRTFSEHPLFAALLLHGGVSALGRTTGAVARSGVLGRGAADFASTSRPMLSVVGESGARVRVARRGSKDIFRRGAQRAYDRRLSVARNAQGRELKDARGRPVLVAPARKTDKLLKQRADFIASRANAVERNTRAIVAREVRAAAPVRQHRGGKLGQRVGTAYDRAAHTQPLGRARVVPQRAYRIEKDLVPLAMEGTIRPGRLVADLRKERTRLEGVYQAYKRGDAELDPVQRHTNRVRARTIDRALKDPRALANEQGLFASARVLAQKGNHLSARAVERGLLNADASVRAKLFPYAQSHMGAKPVEHADGTVTLRAGDGTFLSNDQIHADMRANGVNPDHIAYLPHRGDVRGARAYHQQFRLNRPNLDQESRTGAAYAKGATETSFNLPLEHMVRQSNTLTRSVEFDRLIHDVGVRHPSGRYFTWKEAQAYASRAGRDPSSATTRVIPGEPELVPVRALPAKYDEARSQLIQNEQNPAAPGASSRLVRDQASRLFEPDPRDPNARNVVLVPRTIRDRLEENLGGNSAPARGFQAATAAFRTTVLPFSTKWLTGNIVEALLRSGVAGVTPRDVRIGKRLINEMGKQDPAAAQQYLSHLISGLLYSEKGLTVHRTAEDFAGQLGGRIAHSPVGRAGKAGIKAAATPGFFVNGLLEHSVQYGVVGKLAREQIQEVSGSWFKAMRAQDQALADAARGLRDTAHQEMAARLLDETLGKYSRFSPRLRFAIQTYAPFLPWYLNSIRFVMWTLPAHHPVLTSVVVAAEAAFQKDWEAQHKDIPARSGLKTAIPSHGGFVDVARYTPFGFPGPLAAGDLGSAGGVILPQASSIQLGLLGKDPFGNDLKVPSGKLTTGQQLLYTANQALQGFVPLVSIAQRAREGGRKPYATSTVFKPVTQPPKAGQPKVSAANRILNPVRPVFVSKSRQGGGSSELQQIMREATQGSSSGDQDELRKIMREATGK